MLKRSAFAVVLLLLVSSVAMSQTQQQWETKWDADTLGNINVPYARTSAQNSRDSAMETLSDAMGMRAECVTLGATSEQLAPGDSYLGPGNSDIDDGDDFFSLGQTSHGTGDAAKAEGDAWWAIESYSAACTVYNSESIPAHEVAEDYYWDAYHDFGDANVHYCDAYLEFYYLWFELQ